MTNAEIQKAFRKRKKETAYGESRFETWISYETKDDIAKLVRHAGTTKKEIMAAAIHALKTATLAEMTSEERDEFRKPIVTVLPDNKAGGEIK